MTWTWEQLNEYCVHGDEIFLLAVTGRNYNSHHLETVNNSNTVFSNFIHTDARTSSPILHSDIHANTVTKIWRETFTLLEAGSRRTKTDDITKL